MKQAAPIQSATQLHPTEERWFAVHTRFKCEKQVQKRLAQKNIECYLPLRTQIRKYDRKLRKSEIPLIPCYVFVRITEKNYKSILETEHVVGFVKVGKDLIAVPDQEIQTLRQVNLEAEVQMEGGNRQLEPGEHIEICAGNLVGLKGIVVERENRQWFKVSLDTLGLDFLVSIDGRFLQKDH